MFSFIVHLRALTTVKASFAEIRGADECALCPPGLQRMGKQRMGKINGLQHDGEEGDESAVEFGGHCSEWMGYYIRRTEDSFAIGSLV